MNADGSDVQRLTSNEANDIGPIWSPDGKQIAFTSFRENGAAYVVDAYGNEESSLAVSGRPVTWSPDGQSLLIENDGQLVLSGADGRNPKELTKAGEPALDGEYSPDGKDVYYRSKVNGTWTLMSVDTEQSSQKPSGAIRESSLVSPYGTRRGTEERIRYGREKAYPNHCRPRSCDRTRSVSGCVAWRKEQV